MKRTILAAAVVAVTTAAAMVCGMAATPGPGPAAASQPSAEEFKARHEALLAPGTAVTLEMLEDLVQLEVRLNPSTQPQVMGFSGGISIFAMPQYQAAFKKYGGELAQTLVAKQAEVRGACVQTLLKMPGKLSTADQAKVRPWVPGVLESMSKEEVTMVLNARWGMAQSPELLPVLLKMYDGLPDEQVSAGKYGASEERNALLRRAYELSPEQVRPRVLSAIQDPGQRFNELWVTSLLGLPDKELPEMDDVFLAMIKTPPRTAGSVPSWIWTKLVARYGTAKIEGEVKKAYEPGEGRWACALQQSMVAYFLRVDPEYGRQVLAKSLASRQTGCWRTLFRDVTALIWTPELEQAAIGSLANRDAEVAVDAAGALCRKGSPAARESLLAALSAAYRANAPTTTPSYKDPDDARRRAIVMALLDGHAWVLTPAELEKIQASAVDSDLVDKCKARAAMTEATLTLASDGKGGTALSLEGERYDALEELEHKASLLSASLKFKCDGDKDDPLWTEFAAWAKAHQRVAD